ncbi:MAG TPA: ABC transporter permease [Acidimicrobiia bacterium]|nr:ABC transporter permease [Acidimicrobiia bacterium]
MNLAKVPPWLRWALYASVGVLVLTVVQGFDDTESLTSVGSAQSMLRWAVPILLAGLGGLYAERAGVVNIGLEGMMILGTWFGAWGAVTYGPWWGVVLGVMGGAMGGLLHAIATVTFGVDHIISGVAVNILAPGIARFLSSEIFTTIDGGSITQSPRVPGVGNVTLPLLAGGNIGTWKTPDLLGWLGRTELFLISDAANITKGLVTRISWVAVIALLLVPATGWLLWRTRFGLRLRICGERPQAGEAQGVNVYRYKYIGVVISGALAGLAGAFIASPDLSGIYLEGQTTGRGFIGLAALIFGNWRPWGVLGGALLFGYPFGIGLRDLSGAASHSLILVNAIGLAAVAIWAGSRGKRSDAVLAGALSLGATVWYLNSDTLPDVVINILPFVIVLLVLIFFAQRLRPPAADGLRYRKGEN